MCRSLQSVRNRILSPPLAKIEGKGCVFRRKSPLDSDSFRHLIPKHFATPWQERKGRWINSMKAAKSPCQKRRIYGGGKVIHANNTRDFTIKMGEASAQ
jgi:hypothetical protein